MMSDPCDHCKLRQLPALGNAPFVGILAVADGFFPIKNCMAKKKERIEMWKCRPKFKKERSRQNFSESGNLIERYCHFPNC